jgi:hypothetical protein
MIEAEPDAPAMVIEGYGKKERGDEKGWENQLVTEAYQYQTDDVNRQNEKFRRDHVNENRADEKTRLAHKKRVAGRAMMFYLERTLNY